MSRRSEGGSYAGAEESLDGTTRAPAWARVAPRDFGVERMLDEYEALFLRFAAGVAKAASP